MFEGLLEAVSVSSRSVQYTDPYNCIIPWRLYFMYNDSDIHGDEDHCPSTLAVL